MPLLTHDPEKLRRQAERSRQWKQDSAKRYQDRMRAEGRTALPKVNRKRQKAEKAIQFGPQAALCRRLLCCTCYPELYGKDMLALNYISETRISDPHHYLTVANGGEDKHTVPLCPDVCHYHCSAPGWSQKRVQAEAGVRFAVVAARIHAHVLTQPVEPRTPRNFALATD